MNSRLALAAIFGMCPQALDLLAEPKKPRIYTHADEERQAKDEEKRQRKAAKRAKLQTKKEQSND